MEMILLLFVILAVCFFSIELLANKGYLNTKQYRVYMLIIFIGFLFLCGQIDKECNKPNKYNTTLNK
jgi:hypothetical protein